MPDFTGGTPRLSQQVISLGGERYQLLGEDVVSQVGGGARSWVETPIPIQEESGQPGQASQSEFSIALTFDGGSGVTFASAALPNCYEYANGWSADAPGKTGTWPRRATLAPVPTTYADSDATHATALSVLQGWILAYSTYVYVARGRYCCKYAIDDTQDSVWPIVEAHDFGTGVYITGRPVVFKGKAYFPLRTGTAGSLARWHELSLPVASTVEQQTVTITGTPTSGTYTLTFDGKTTAAIVYNAASSVVQAALRLITGLEQVTVSSTGTIPNFVHTVVMTGVAGTLATASPPQMTNTDGTSGGTHSIANATTVAGVTDTWRQGSANTQASCFIVNGTKLWRANANTIAATTAVSTPSIDGDWGATTEVGDSGTNITDLGVYLGDNLVFKTDGLYRFTEDLQAVQELPDLASVVDTNNGVGSEFSNGYELVPHKTGLLRWRPGSYEFVGPEQEGALEGGTSYGSGRVASLAPYGKQLFYAANDTYNNVGTVGSFLPQLAEGRGRDYGLIPHTHVVTPNVTYEATRAVTSSTQPVAPQYPGTWSDDSAVGTLAWTNPGNAAAADGVLATATGTGTTHYLKGLAPPVNIPTGATIQGVLAEVGRSGYSTLAGLTPNLNGYVNCIDAAYANVQAGTGTLASATAAGFWSAGQAGDGSYDNWMGLLSFDTSAIPDSASIISAVLTVTPISLNAPRLDTLQARLDDFGGTITTADYVTATAGIAAKTLLATTPFSGLVVDTPISLTSESAFAANINKTGSTRLVMTCAGYVAGTVPTTHDIQSFYDVAAATAAYRPTLTVTYTDILDNVVKLVIGGSVTGNNKNSATAWPGTQATASYGGATDIWGTTPTVAQLNASNFGLVLSAVSTGVGTFNVDFARLTIYYTVPGTADAQSYRIDLQVDTTKTIATGQVYKLPRANLPVVNDPSVNHAASNVQLYSSRYTAPNRNVQKIYREVELWFEASPQTNTPGLQVWASVDDGTAYQLSDLNGSAKTALTTGAHRFYFPKDSTAFGHYVQLQFKVPATSGGTVAVAANFRDVVLRMKLQAYNAKRIQATLLLAGGEFADGTPVRRTVKAQKADLVALNQPGASIAYQGPYGETGYLSIAELTIKEAAFKQYDEPQSVAQLVLETLAYDL